MKRLMGQLGMAAMMATLPLLPGCGGGSSGPHSPTVTFAPYLVPPQPPVATDSSVIALLNGSSVTAQAGFIVAHLQGTPYQMGFQNGYLTAQSADYAAYALTGPRDSPARNEACYIAQYKIWSKIPPEYQEELQGIADGMVAAGYSDYTLWDVVALNSYYEYTCYGPKISPAIQIPAARTDTPDRTDLGGCSGFVATGDATVDGMPVMGHTTWSHYSYKFMSNVMFYVHPQSGYDFCYESYGGFIWSGRDWYQNSAGLLLSETTLVDTVYDSSGIPVMVRARRAAQYAATVDQAVETLLTGNNGAYSNEWLIADATGKIASLQLGGKTYDLNTTYNGFFGSANFDWGPNTRWEEGNFADPYDLANADYGRYVRWGQLKTQHYGHMDVDVGKAMISDTYDANLGMNWPGARTICGESEKDTPGVDPASSIMADPDGSMNGKVSSVSMTQNGLQAWACWGHPSGHRFDADLFLMTHPTWSYTYGPFRVFGLKTFASAGPNPWTLLGQ